jgi:hypothetical protein
VPCVCVMGIEAVCSSVVVLPVVAAGCAVNIGGGMLFWTNSAFRYGDGWLESPQDASYVEVCCVRCNVG